MTETRNIIDHYHYWKHDAILADLDEHRHNFTVLCCNLGNDFNISTVIRNANAFLAKEVIVFGKKKYDRRGAVGTHNYTHFKYFKEEEYEEMVDYIYESNERPRIVAVDNCSRAVGIDNYIFPVDRHVVMVFGQEQIGIPQYILLDLCDDVVYIKQYGSVRSLNVGTASGIAMYDYCSKVIK